ncbi:hypothetical protein [Micromonospora noduli]|uniref:hypothetical protein n=1 Tax=Micromonospora noduli TaxID=709876 RepID=UPI0021ACE589|nr:hypothetical protein [Micromonospora noduli]
MPVVLEVRPGIYQKNAQVAHIHGVRPGAARYRGDLPAQERDSFSNLVLLCLGHHEEVDGDARLDPPELLKQWKVEHEGVDNSVLNRLKVADVATLMKALTELAAPPLERLELITKQLEETGTVTAETVAELKQIIRTMSSSESGIDARTARALAYSAEVFGTDSFDRSARALAHAAEVLPSIVSQMERSRPAGCRSSTDKLVPGGSLLTWPRGAARGQRECRQRQTTHRTCKQSGRGRRHETAPDDNR